MDDAEQGPPRVVVRDGLAHRPAQPWTPTVHALLAHLVARELPVPTPVGVDGGTEVVTALDGEAGADGWAHQATDAGLASLARLLRRVHDATRGWEASPQARWAFPARTGADVVCHGDPGPWNAVWQDGEAVGLFDWDLAHPAPATDDVAYALSYVAPFADDDFAVRWLGFTSPPRRRHRVELFLDAYGGWPGAAGTTLDGVVDAVVARLEQDVENVRVLAAEGIEPQRTWVCEGRLELQRSRVAWARAHRHLVTG